jgi:hypothetical protein
MLDKTVATGVVLLAILGASVVPVELFAECIGPGSTRDGLRRAAAVFVGSVESVEVVGLPEAVRHRVRFRLVEHFKGSKTAQQTLEFVQTPEGFVFAVGQRVLVYADPVQSQTSFSTQCTSTKLANLAANEIRTLRQELGR